MELKTNGSELDVILNYEPKKITEMMGEMKTFFPFIVENIKFIPFIETFLKDGR